jgi:hypothetical protein
MSALRVLSGRYWEAQEAASGRLRYVESAIAGRKYRRDDLHRVQCRLFVFSASGIGTTIRPLGVETGRSMNWALPDTSRHSSTAGKFRESGRSNDCNPNLIVVGARRAVFSSPETSTPAPPPGNEVPCAGGRAAGRPSAISDPSHAAAIPFRATQVLWRFLPRLCTL